jgi:hypothetical protein
MTNATATVATNVASVDENVAKLDENVAKLDETALAPRIQQVVDIIAEAKARRVRADTGGRP